MFDIATEHVDGGWSHSGTIHDQVEALHEYTRHVERMYKGGIRRVQLRREGHVFSEVTM